MLLNLHVKNLALIDEADIYFDEGLNILTGETGAGKSILLGSVGLALGGKASRDMIGKHGDFASVELLFQVDDECVKKLADKDIFVSDNQVLISRKFTENKNIMKINGENVTLATVKSITSLLIDIHGQHEHQSLLYPANHLAILDRFGKEKIERIKNTTKLLYDEYKQICDKLAEYTINEEEKRRNIDFLTYEINEIESATLHEHEDEELEEQFKKIRNAEKIATSIAAADGFINAGEGISSLINKAYKEILRASEYDDKLADLAASLLDADDIINSFSKDLSSYNDSMEFEEEEFERIEKRLDVINNLKAKHGKNIADIFAALKKKQNELDFYNEYDRNLDSLNSQKQEVYNNLLAECSKLTKLRENAASELVVKIKEAIASLNFFNNEFDIRFTQLDNPTGNGIDHVEFMISTNPGEEIKPIAKVASGGELSRIMLAIKSVLASQDEIDTLIFDEIDAGISGITAQRVADKLCVIAGNRQVICITHLPQIAAMADKHFKISKEVVDNHTVTSIVEQNYDESITEIARLLGGENVSDAVITSARELKKTKK